TGSQGKTGTKDYLAYVLSAAGPTVATVGSFNNELGFPLTVLRADLDTEFLVLEMGARGIGHIAYLCEIAPPRIAAVLNVGTAHVGEFGSREAIAQAKGELVEALDDTGTAVLNADDPLVAAMADRTSGQVVTFGTKEYADVRLAGVDLDDLGRASFTLSADATSADVSLAVTGAHQAHNAAAAAAVAIAEGMDLGSAAAALGRVTQVSRWRMELTELGDGRLLINDAYNANPESMRAALDALVAIAERRGGRAVAVLGEMRELGADSATAHADLGRDAAARGVAHLIGVGEVTLPMVEAAIDHIPAASVPDRAAALAWLRSHLRPHDVVLIKASRGDRLELLATSLI
ncbi:MAG: UDP-N-acetylmuramoyl-tripeptide--D-alanyl-D-alanine ligase, partial [Actinomycetales bacterium]